jgi:hypothetical protein
VAFEPRLLLLELRLGVLAGRDVLHGEQDELHIIEAARVQQDRAPSNLRRLLLDSRVVCSPVRLHRLNPGEDL